MDTLIFMVLGARAVISFCMRSAIPGYMVVPPDKTLFAYRSLRMSMSHFMMLLYVVSWIPADSIPTVIKRADLFERHSYKSFTSLQTSRSAQKAVVLKWTAPQSARSAVTLVIIKVYVSLALRIDRVYFDTLVRAVVYNNTMLLT